MSSSAVKWPKISIVIPSYNQSQYLEETLSSIVDQEYPNLELIVMDGGSTDDSVKIIKKYSKYITYWQSQKDGGQSAAIHEGFLRSTGEILGWLNSDDVYCSDALFKVGKAFLSNRNIRWLYGNTEIIRSDSVLLTRRICPQIDMYDLVNFHFYLPQESTFFHRTLYFDVGGIELTKNFAMDYDLWLKFCNISQPLYINEFLGKFRFVPGQKSSYIDKYINEEYESKRHYSEYIDNSISLKIKYGLKQIAARPRRLIANGPINTIKYRIAVFSGSAPQMGFNKNKALLGMAIKYPLFAVIVILTLKSLFRK